MLGTSVRILDADGEYKYGTLVHVGDVRKNLVYATIERRGKLEKYPLDEIIYYDTDALSGDVPDFDAEFPENISISYSTMFTSEVDRFAKKDARRRNAKLRAVCIA